MARRRGKTKVVGSHMKKGRKHRKGGRKRRGLKR